MALTRREETEREREEARRFKGWRWCRTCLWLTWVGKPQTPCCHCGGRDLVRLGEGAEEHRRLAEAAGPARGRR